MNPTHKIFFGDFRQMKEIDDKSVDLMRLVIRVCPSDLLYIASRLWVH
jgi:hypothetical protein